MTNQEWKLRNNDMSKLTVAKFIENTIAEEVSAHRKNSSYYADADADAEEGYYCAIYQLNELM